MNPYGSPKGRRYWKKVHDQQRFATQSLWNFGLENYIERPQIHSCRLPLPTCIYTYRTKHFQIRTHLQTCTMYRFAKAFPGAIFTIPCDGPPVRNLVYRKPSTSDAASESHACHLPSPAQSTPTIASADIGRLTCTPSSATSTRTWSTSSTAVGDSAYGYDSNSPCSERLTGTGARGSQT